MFAAIHHWNPFLIEFSSGFGIRWYGLAYVMGFWLGFLLLAWLARRGYSVITPEQVGDFVFGVALFGVLLGGRLGYFLFYDFSDLLAHPFHLLRVWEGGMSSHGGLLGVALYCLWYSRRHRVPWCGLGDNIVVVAPIGIFFGRIANFINGELYGRITSVPWALKFPGELLDDPALADRATIACMTKVDPALNTPGAIIDALSSPETGPQVRAILEGILHARHPSQLYAAFLEGALLFALCFWLRTRVRLRQGVLTGIFFIAYAVVRIFGEQFREPDVGIAFTFGLTRGQFLSTFMVLIGVGFILWGRRYGRPSPRPGVGEAAQPAKR
ncbi:MAG TPA: prolipoprotein diacylglyceryl transferase [Chthoniobacteraceae bacterium]|nr:prolipoprotein diacylglyceryl transferase [Chthoniobacteraceae bacterium]